MSRIFVVRDGEELRCLKADNSEDAQRMMNFYSPDIRELSTAEITAGFGDAVHMAGDEFTEIRGEDLQSCVVCRNSPPSRFHEWQGEEWVENDELRLSVCAAEIRAERDARLHAFRWRIERNRDEQALVRPQTEESQGLLEYAQALRDLPQQEGFPWKGAGDPAVPWPSEPLLPGGPHE